MNTLLAPIERRTNARQTVNMTAIVKLPSLAGIPCKVTNITPIGALVEFDKPTLLPSQFRIIIPEIWFEADCEVRHKTAMHMGVMFVSNLREALARIVTRP